MLKTAALCLAFLPSLILIIHDPKRFPEYFLWLNGVCSWVAGYLLLKHTIKNPVWRMIASFFVGIVFFVLNFAVAFFIGCSRLFRGG